jgi:hypothetical protein
MSYLTPIFPVCCAICCVFAVGYCCVEDLHAGVTECPEMHMMTYHNHMVEF